MARTIDLIETAIEDEKALYAELDQIDSPSATSIWRRIRKVVASAIFTHEKIFDDHKTDILEILDQSRYGSLPWLVRETKKFQYGDTLAIDEETLTYEYPVLDESAQIVKYAAAVMSSGLILLKVAKDLGAVLSGPEVTALEAYIDRIIVPGQQVRIVNQDPDLVNYNVVIYYDGTLIEADFQTAALAAIEAFFAQLPFDGDLLLSAIVDIFQAVPGAVDVVLMSSEAQPDAGSWQLINREYNPRSGRFTLQALGAGAHDSVMTLIAT